MNIYEGSDNENYDYILWWEVSYKKNAQEILSVLR